MLAHYFLIALFGAFGACTRAWISNLNQLQTLPLGTVVANLLGCFLLGLLSGASETLLPENLRKPIATGFLGSLTTFSTFSLETLMLLEKEGLFTALLYFVPQLIAGLLLAFLGLTLGRSLQ
jgi:fluoride exporter